MVTDVEIKTLEQALTVIDEQNKMLEQIRHTKLGKFIIYHPTIEPTADEVFLQFNRTEKALAYARKWLQPVQLEKNHKVYTPNERVQEILEGK